jgi:hypothetical protein
VEIPDLVNNGMLFHGQSVPIKAAPAAINPIGRNSEQRW